MTKVFISGPITGKPGYNRNAFMQAETWLKKGGHKVMNPAVLPLGFEWKDYMEICVRMLDACDSVYMLKGWQDSKGATLEREYARRHKKQIWEEGDNECPTSRTHSENISTPTESDWKRKA